MYFATQPIPHSLGLLKQESSEMRDEPMFLSKDELISLSGYARSSLQVRWLRVNGIPVLVNAAGQPRVLRRAVDQILSPKEHINETHARQATDPVIQPDFSKLLNTRQKSRRTKSRLANGA